MKILAVHNRYLMTGGEDISHQTEIDLLRSHGHQVDEYVEDNLRIARIGKLKTAFRTVWSVESYKDMRNLLHKDHYDVMIVQNFFPLISPSIFYAAAQEKTPVIQFIRNYRLVCLNGTLLKNGTICTECIGRKIPLPGIIHGCYRDSIPASLVVAIMLVVHRMLGSWNKKINRFISLTEFSRKILIESGINPEKIIVRPNTVYPDPGAGDGSGNYALFTGRLSIEKGIDILLDAWSKVPAESPLIIAGDGPLREEVLRQIKGRPNIQYSGQLPYTKMLEMIKKARFLVFPSIWYEGMPRTIIEAFAAGTPVLASNLGAMKEMVRDGWNGFLFPAGDAEGLAELATNLFSEKNDYTEMRLNARESYEKKYTDQTVYGDLERIMDELVKEKTG